MAAFINAATLVIISGYLIYEAIERLITPAETPVNGVLVAWLAGFSIVANGLSVLLVKKHSENNMNMRSAYLHLFSDMLSSIAVLVGGILMYFFQLAWIDALLSIVIAIYLILASWKLLVKTMRVLMQFTPPTINIEKMSDGVSMLEGIENMHHVHLWQLNDSELHLEAHLDLSEDVTVSQSNLLLNKVREYVQSSFGIEHCTFQVEYKVGDDKSLIVNERKNAEY